MNNTAREAFDLHNKACRRNFKSAFRRKWCKGWWWALVISDTRNRICSPKKRSPNKRIKDCKSWNCPF